jgi:hypothetical protein
MTDSDDTTPFLETHQWDLAKAHLDRADQSGNLIRGLLFAGAGAAIGFILHRNQNALAWHLLPLLLMLVACGLIFWSWDQQKKKARHRFDLLMAGQLKAFQEYKPTKNYIIDRIAAALIGPGVFAELILCA